MDYSLEYFLGKIVTIFTSRTSRDFPANSQVTAMQFANYFTGRVRQIDSTGIWLVHEQTDQLSYFAWNWIVGVCEEQEVGEDHPTVKKALERVEQERQAKAREQQAIAEAQKHAHEMMCQQQPDLTELSVEKLGQVIKEKKK